MNRLTRDFFLQPTIEVAQSLLGKVLLLNNEKYIITETEAYIGTDDPACHAARGKTPRNEIMFGPAGYTYVYFIYGMYYCLNFVTEKEGFPAAVLIRSLRHNNIPSKKLNGPGKLCRELGITRERHNAIDLISSADLFVIESGFSPSYEASPRVGIKVGTEKLWRFLINEGA